MKKSNFLALTYRIALFMATVAIVFSIMCFIFIWIPFSHFYSVLVFVYFAVWGFFLFINKERGSFKVFLPISFVISLTFYISQFSATKVLAAGASFVFMLFLLVLGVVGLKPPLLKVLFSCLFGIICAAVTLSYMLTVVMVGWWHNGMVVNQSGDYYDIFNATYGVDYGYKYYHIEKKNTVTLIGIGRFYNTHGERYSYHG